MYWFNFPQLSVDKIFSIIHCVAQVFGYSSFQYPAKKLKLSLPGCAFLILNLFASCYQFYMYVTVIVYQGEILLTNNKIANIGINIVTISSLIVRVIILILNFFLRGKIFNSVKKVEELDSEVNNDKIKLSQNQIKVMLQLKSVGITFNNNKDFVIFVLLWLIKMLVIGLILLKCEDTFQILNAFFLITGVYITSDIYLGTTFLMLKRIGGVSDKLKYRFIHTRSCLLNIKKKT
jgi:hypothetical protein